MLPDSPRIVRIFISSPGDVNEERAKAQQVIADLQRAYTSQALLMPVLWEDLALPATASFQESIDYLLAQEPIDIAVFILWSRLGSPLGNSITRPDGRRYRSGTEREFDVMLTAFEQSGRQRPLILAYTRNDEATWKQSLTRCQRDQLEEMIGQQRLAEAFIKEQFHDKDGHNLRAYHSYREPVGFAQRLRTHLRSNLDELLVANSTIPRWQETPYRSLEVFDIRHAPIFFGRSEETCDVMDRLRKQHDAGCGFVVIVGASGSGKSSLARAGVAASLIEHAYDERIRNWRSCVIVPGMQGEALLRGFTEKLIEAIPEMLASGASRADVARGLEKDAELACRLSVLPALTLAAATAGGEVRLLVVLDQLEELWTIDSISVDDRELFLNAIEALAHTGRVDIVATLRSDFYAQAQASPAFMRLKGEFGSFDLVAPGVAAMQRMIVEPARMSALQFESDERTGKTLDQTILEDALRDPSSLPLVQYALAELYDQRNSAERVLTFAAYKQMGGVEGAIGQRAASTYAQLPQATQAALNEILPLLVTVDSANDQKTVRRRASFNALTATVERKSLTQALIAARFLTTDREGANAVASLAHEALLRSWDTLADWVGSNRQQLRLRASIEQNQKRWDQSNRDPSLLLSPGLPLEEGRQLLRSADGFLTPGLAVYVRESVSHADASQRRRSRLRMMVMSVLSLLTVIAIGASAYSARLRRIAIEQAQIAINERTAAQVARGKALAQETLAKSRLVEQIEQAKKGSQVLFTFGESEYERSRFDSGVEKLIAAWQLRAADDPLKESYGRVLTDRMTRGGRSWAAFPNENRGVRFVVFSPDGTQLAMASDDKSSRIWHVATGTPIGVPMLHEDIVWSVAYSPDGTRLATDSFDKKVRLWNAQTGALLGEPMRHDELIHSIAFSSDGLRLATSSGHFARIWNALTGQLMGEPIQHDSTVRSAAFSPDGTRLVTACEDETARFWDGKTGLPQGDPMRHEGPVTAAKFSPDGTRLVTTSNRKDSIGQSARLWDAKTGTPFGEPMQHNEIISSVAFNPDGTRVATASFDKSARLWSAQTGSPTGNPMRHEAYVQRVAFSPDGTQLATVCSKTVRLWDGLSGTPLSESMEHEDDINSIAFSPDGKQLATATKGKTIRLWETTPTSLGKPMRHQSMVTSVAFSPDGSRLATSSEDHTARLWDAQSGVALGEPMRHEDTVNCVVFSPDGNRLATGSYDHTVRFWDASTGASVGDPLRHDSPILSIAFSPDGTRLTTGSLYGSTVRIWDAQSGAPVGERGQYKNPVPCIAYRPDGQMLASASDDHTARFWDGQTGKALGQPIQHNDKVPFVAFSPDGSCIVTCSWDKTARRWDARTGTAIGEPLRHANSVLGAVFSPAGNLLATLDLYVARIWDARTGAFLRELKPRLGGFRRAVFSPDGNYLAAVYGNAAEVFDVTTGARLGDLMRHQVEITTGAFSPNGNRLVTAAKDGTIQLWNVERLEVKSVSALINCLSIEREPTLTLDKTFLAELEAFRSQRILLYRSGLFKKVGN